MSPALSPWGVVAPQGVVAPRGVLSAGSCGVLLLRGEFANSATPCDCVQREIGRVSNGGWSLGAGASMGGAIIVVGGSLSTLGSCGGSALTLGVDAGVITLGAEAGADGAVGCSLIAGGC